MRQMLAPLPRHKRRACRSASSSPRSAGDRLSHSPNTWPCFVLLSLRRTSSSAPSGSLAFSTKGTSAAGALITSAADAGLPRCLRSPSASLPAHAGGGLHLIPAGEGSARCNNKVEASCNMWDSATRAHPPAPSSASPRAAWAPLGITACCLSAARVVRLMAVVVTDAAPSWPLRPGLRAGQGAVCSSAAARSAR